MNIERHQNSTSLLTAAVVLWWLPVGAGAPTRVSQVASHWWEWLEARYQHRTPQQLVHALLHIHCENQRFVIEMAPEWSASPDPHQMAVTRGPVGSVLLGRSRFFRYEIRCWPSDETQDGQYAIGGPVIVSSDENVARSVVENIEDVPTLVWGRKVGANGDMWNSNSLVSCLLTMAGIDVTDLSPPPGTRAPGWAAGIAVAQLDLAAQE